MKRALVVLLLVVPSFLYADVSWKVYISTTPPLYNNFTETVISSTTGIKLPLSNNDPTIDCYAWAPWYFQPEGFPYPLVQHRSIECYLGKEYHTLIETGCSLKQDSVEYANLILQTPYAYYNIILNCSNFVDSKNNP